MTPELKTNIEYAIMHFDPVELSWNVWESAESAEQAEKLIDTYYGGSDEYFNHKWAIVEVVSTHKMIKMFSAARRISVDKTDITPI